MRVGVLITNGGPHSHEDWAVATAGQIIDIGRDANASGAAAARKLENRIIDVLAEGHQKVQERERDRIDEFGGERLLRTINPTHFLDETVDAVIDAAKGTPFEEHFSQPHVRDYVAQVIGNHFATSIQVERSWHADSNPDDPDCRKFKAEWHGRFGEAPAEETA